MTYKVKIKDILIDNTNLTSIKFMLKKDKNDGFANSKTRVVIEINSRLFTKDTSSAVKKDLLKKILDLKDEYFNVEISYENVCYSIDKMYIYNLEQIFENGKTDFSIILYQKYTENKKEINIIEN